MNAKELSLISMFAAVMALTASADLIITMATGIFGLGIFIMPILGGSLWTFVILVFASKRWRFLVFSFIGGLLVLPFPIAGPPFYIIKFLILLFLGFLGDVLFHFGYRHMNLRRWSGVWSGILWLVQGLLILPKYTLVGGESLMFLKLLIPFIIPISFILGVVGGFLGYSIWLKVGSVLGQFDGRP